MAAHQKDIYILGIHDGHNAGAAIIKNGKVISAISEERLTQLKNNAGTPIASIAKVIALAEINPSQINAVAIASYIRVVRDHNVEKTLPLFKLHMSLAPYLHNQTFIKYAVKSIEKLNNRSDLYEILQTLGINNVPISYYEHHLVHAACAYFQRPWKDKTLVFTLDGMGDGLSATVSIGEGTKLTRIAATGYYDSLGNNIYAEVTRYLGMKRGEHEYKVMGLAPYGNPAETIDVFHKIMRLNPKNKLVFQNKTNRYMETLQPMFQKLLKYKRFDHVAAGAQKFYEDILVSWIKEAISQTGIKKICAAGGGFLNVKTNMMLRNCEEIQDMFIYPAAEDSGLPVGVAMLGYVQYCEDHNMEPIIEPIKAIYYGEEYTPEQIELFLTEKKLLKKARKISPEEVATMLSKGNIFGRFAGRDEWGPRALGNRSIIADPRNSDIIQRLNQAIKQRDFWMPFAPSILQEDQSRYLSKPRFSPYMIEAFDTTSEAKDITAAVHPADKTTRPMTVNNWNPSFQAIIRAFKKKTGVGAVLNTSFNLHGYPMVATPEQAVWTLNNSDLDGVLLGDWFVPKNKP
jgi:carbamoyltransferase